MDYPIQPVGRPIDSPHVRPVGPRRERGGQTPFELGDDGESGRPGERAEHDAHPKPQPAHDDRPVAPPGDDEVGAHLDLSA